MEKRTRLEILEASLLKKQAAFDQKLENHFATVKQTNGQPLNDKRNGAATLRTWDRQNYGLRRLKQGIETTENAIEIEKARIAACEAMAETLPAPILEMLSAGELTQWRKHPNRFFVPGVEKARIIWNEKEGGYVSHKYLGSITDADQRKKFAQVFNRLFQLLNE
jgi:hypothetical protein